MMSKYITQAVLIALNTEPVGATYDSVYGDETLLNPALIAMSKAGIPTVKIICVDGQRKKIELMITSVRKRIALEYDVSELRSDEMLSKKISCVVGKWDGVFLIFEADKIVHPTFFDQADRKSVV